MRRAAFVLLTVVLAGCGSRTVLPATPMPTATIAPTTTPQISFAVAVTAVRPTPRPTATATPFVPPAGPYVALSRRKGPPSERRIVVRAGHLPPSTPAQLEWTATGSRAPLATQVATNKKGNFRAAFTIPASPPGVYHVTVVVNGVDYASAPYKVVSDATMAVIVKPTGGAEQLTIRGAHFLSHTRLLILATPLKKKAKPFELERVRTDGRGDFTSVVNVKGLTFGEYSIHAYAINGTAAQMAVAYFEVVI